MSVIGIDLSTKYIDYVKINEDDPQDNPEWRRYTLEGTDAWERSLSVRDHSPPPTHDWWDDVTAIGIEEPYGRFVVGKLYRVQGLVIGRLPRVRLDRWMPGEWRKTVGLKGNATKDDVAAYVHSLPFDTTAWEQDACDAYCVARAMAYRIEDESAK